MPNTTVVEVASDPTWAYIMTGATALAGIAGTLWQGIRAQKAEARNLTTTLHADAERARLADKRRIYAQCHAALLSSYTAAAMVEGFGKHASDEPSAAYAEALLARTKASEQTAAAVAELILIAPEHVAEPATEAQVLIGADDARDLGAAADVIGKLLTAMRADFGEPPLREWIPSPPPPAS